MTNVIVNDKQDDDVGEVSKIIILYKIFLGIVELILGLGIIFWGHKIVIIYNSYKQQELIEDPNDLIFRFLNTIIPYVFEHRSFIIFLLLLLGLVKVVGGIGYLYKKHWGLDLLVGLIFLLLPFDLYDLATHPTPLKVIYLLINLLIALYLINFKPKQYFNHLKRSLASLSSS